MVNPTRGWDRIPVYGWWQVLPGVPEKGVIRFTLTGRMRRKDGRMIYPGGTRIDVTIGEYTDQDAEVREAVRASMKAAAQAEQGENWDEARWDEWWDKNLTSAIFTSFWAVDDPDITPEGVQVKVEEILDSNTGATYHIEPKIADLFKPIIGINLAEMDIPPGTPTPQPVYAKGQPGGIAGLDRDGDVIDSQGRKALNSESILESLNTEGSPGRTTLEEIFPTHERLTEVATGQSADLTDSAIAGALQSEGSASKSIVNSWVDGRVAAVIEPIELDLTSRAQQLELDTTARLNSFDEAYNTRATALEADIASQLSTFDENYNTRATALEADVAGQLSTFDENYNTRATALEADTNSRILGIRTEVLDDLPGLVYAYVAKQGGALSRFAWRLDNTPTVKIVGVGDSITEGTTVTADGGVPGVDDYLSLVATELDAAHPATVTRSNRAVSGRTAHTSFTLGDFAAAIADAGDLYIISFGHNDLRSDTSTPGTGYPRASMVRAMEKMIRRIRDEVPGADIAILLQNPYTPAGYGANTHLVLQNNLLRPLAVFYGCAIIDTYTPFIDLGDYSALMADAGHPNAAGHRLIADTVKAVIPTTGQPVTPAVPASDLYGAAQLARTWDTTTKITNLEATPSRSVRYLHGGAGWSSAAAAPHTSSTVGDFIRVLSFGDEVVLRLDTGPTHGTVAIDIDTRATAYTIDLGAYSTGQRYFPLVGLGHGAHVIVVKVAAGSVTFRGAEAWSRQAYSLDLTADVTATGTWTSSAQISTSPSGIRLTSSTLGDSLTFDIMGTGVVLAHNKYPSNQQLEVQVDGGAWASVEVSETTSSGGLFGTANVVSGLPFGKHTISLRSAGARSSFIVYDVTVLDQSTTGYVRDVQIATALRSTV